MSSWTAPTVAEFKAFFVRDFNFAPSGQEANLDYIQDADVSRAIAEAIIDFNSGLFGANATSIFMYLAAFCLTKNLTISRDGLASQAKFLVNSISVGSVSTAFQIPEAYMKDPIVSRYTQNGYGMRYLELVWPYMVGNVSVKHGTTTFD